MSNAGPIGPGTRRNIVRAHRADRDGLLGRPVDHEPPPYWTAADMLFSRVAERPDHPYLIFYDDEYGQRVAYTYAAVGEQVCRIARFLTQKLGLGPGDVIAHGDLYNHADTVALYYAAWATGMAVLPLNMREDRRRHHFVLRHAGAKALFARDRKDPGSGENYLTRLTAIAADLGIAHVVQLGGGERRAPHWLDRAVEEVEPAPPDIFFTETDAIVPYVCGGGGDPRGVLLSHRLLYAVRAFVTFNRCDESDVFMTSLPLFNMAPLVCAMLAAAYTGGHFVLNRRFVRSNFFERVEDEGVTLATLVPAMLAALSGHVKDQRINLKKQYPAVLKTLRSVLCVPGRIHAEVLREFNKAVGIRVNPGWGQNEVAGWGTQVPPNLTADEYRKLVLQADPPPVGVPTGGVRLAVVDPETGKWLGPGKRGELVVAGPSIMKGYFRNATTNEKSFANGVLSTGEEAYYRIRKLKDGSEQPFFYLADRYQDVIERGGLSFAAAEIDVDLIKLPPIERAVAVGFRHRAFGEEVGAAVQLRPGGTLDDRTMWRHFMTLGYPWDKVPKVIRRSDNVPALPATRDQRQALAGLFSSVDNEYFPRPDFWKER